MADCACRSRSQMASKPPRSTLSRVGLSSSGDPGPAHKCPLIISSCRKTGWSSPRPCYQAPLHIPAQTCYVTWATTCPHTSPTLAQQDFPLPSCPRGAPTELPSAQHPQQWPTKPLSNAQDPGVSSLRHPAHHPCTGRCSGPASKRGYSVVEVG